MGAPVERAQVRARGARMALRFAERTATGMDVRRAAIAAGAAVLVIWLGGVLHATGLVSLRILSLDKEGTIPTAFSGALLLWAAGAAFVAAYRRAPGDGALWVVGVLFAFMAFDEVFFLHEAADSAIDVVDWQVVYLPVVALALAGWAAMLRSIHDRTARAAWLAGAACWVISQVLELFQWDGRLRPGSIDGDEGLAEVRHQVEQPEYVAKMLPEELLEMSGSLLFALVLVHLARHAASR